MNPQDAVEITLRPGMEGVALALGLALLFCLALAVLINLPARK